MNKLNNLCATNEISNLVVFFFLGGPMDHGGPMPMGSDFGGMPSEPGQFLPQQGPGPDMMPGSGNGGSGSGRGGSPEFMSPGNFADNPQQLNEGLVW